MSNRKSQKRGTSSPGQGHLWRGRQEHDRTPELLASQQSEFPNAGQESEGSVSRRHFMGLMGASAALAGAGLTGCVRKPQQRIVPHTTRPEDTIPGKPTYFRTALNVGPRVLGVHVESQDGRPTKIEGNPDHPMSFGATDSWAQAEVLSLYDRDRSRAPRRGAQITTWETLSAFLGQHLAGAGKGEKLALLVDATPSPTNAGLLLEVRRRFPSAGLFRHDPTDRVNEAAGLMLIGVGRHTISYRLELASCVLSIDADFLGVDGDAVRNTKGFMDGRRVAGAESKRDVGAMAGSAFETMSRLYAVEPGLSVTGMSADERLALPGTESSLALMGVAAELAKDAEFASRMAAAGGREIVSALAAAADKSAGWAIKHAAFIRAAARDLAAVPGHGIVMVGERQPPWVHAVGHALNAALGSVGPNRPAGFVPDGERLTLPGLDAFAADAARGRFDTLVVLGGNPAYDAPADLKLEEALDKVKTGIHLGYHTDETYGILVARCREAWHLPKAHALESWGDLRSADGTIALQQPLIAPLFDAVTVSEVLAVFAGRPGARLVADEKGVGRDAGHAAVKRRWHNDVGGPLDEKAWRRALHVGRVEGTGGQVTLPRWSWPALLKQLEQHNPQKLPEGALEVNFVLDSAVCDGRYANNAWLQELPDPVSKVTWDNAALINPATAERLGIKPGRSRGATFHVDLVTVQLGQRELVTAALIMPGIADGVVVLSLGYGRGKAAGQVADGAGFNAYLLRRSRSPSFAAGAKVTMLGTEYPLATTQEHWSLSPREGYPERPLVHYMSLATYKAGFDADKAPRGTIAEKEAVVADHNETHKLFEPPERRDGDRHFSVGQQWAMTVDLTTCTGCSACVVACQAENNIPIVGKEEVLNGREMHWIRVDRYFTGTWEEPGPPVVKPVMCAHCEAAPCETVCPVAATQHSPEGLNDMAYNRCIGTRYCANNCPYKVRRFNFYNYQGRQHDENPLVQLARNPDVTVRFRGVMEKCTYCVQRVNEAKVAAKRDGSGVVPDGAAVPACAQACPAQAITFGDKSDPDSAVTKQRANDRNYALLGELNIAPRTTYLGRLRNEFDKS